MFANIRRSVRDWTRRAAIYTVDNFRETIDGPNTHVLFVSGALVALFVALLLSLRFSRQPQLDFPDCKAAILNGSAIARGNITYNGTVDRDGNLVGRLDKIEGVRFAECETMCGKGWQREEWNDIFNSLSGWLLPWLALTAQLPFQTRDKARDIASVFLVIGSPILAMYSLLQTFYNSNWIREQCRGVVENGDEQFAEKLEHMKYVAEVLDACQHAPMQVTNDVKLTHFARFGQTDWWKNLAETLEDTGRKTSASFWAQLFLAGISYVFTLIVAFGEIGSMSPFELSINQLDNPTGYGLAR